MTKKHASYWILCFFLWVKTIQRQTQKCLEVNNKILQDDVQGFDLITRKQLIEEYIRGKGLGNIGMYFHVKNLTSVC